MTDVEKNCPLGVENSTRINGMEDQMKRHSEMLDSIAKRLERFVPVWVTVFLMVISGVTTGLIVECLRRGAS